MVSNGQRKIDKSFERWPENKVERGFNREKERSDIIVCIHNALEDVKECLDSILQNTKIPYSLILVNDGSGEETTRFLENFAARENVILINNQTAKGYTFAANQGLQRSTSSYVVLLNSDTEVTPHWLERMISCAEMDKKIGIVGPLSNTASWQSIPKLSENLDWAENRLPEGMNIAEMGNIVFEQSLKFYPKVPFINGFCFLIKRSVIEDIGFLDEENFGPGYGEEDDYCIRAKTNGWELAVADDVYVYHKQSLSYSHERRKQLSLRARNKLCNKYGEPFLLENVQLCVHNPYLALIRSWFQFILDQYTFTKEIKEKWNGKKIVFVVTEERVNEKLRLIIQEASVMRKMGLDVKLITLNENKKEIQDYCTSMNTDLPVFDSVQVEVQAVLAASAVGIAASLKALKWLHSYPIKGAFYIFDFEPLNYPKGSAEYQEVMNAYRSTEAVFLTKSRIIQKLIADFAGKTSSLISPSIILPKPTRLNHINRPTASINIAITTSPTDLLTKKVIVEISQLYKSLLQIDWIFIDEETQFPLDKKIDLLIDFSSYQNIGLIAMEAMLNGTAVILPKNGIGKEFVKHKKNGWLVDIRSYRECYFAVNELIKDLATRKGIQERAQVQVYSFSPEYAVSEILKAVLI
ncbi:glycosyltransferase [Neobacillus bataviensis]|uniref:glycosyltransferase n=1 Tax=Neobacillus bataviensis TaxID=220685 RepID=UPI001CBDDA39|nr:glycosyltransferase [Neobacillus bataviensis]